MFHKLGNLTDGLKNEIWNFLEDRERTAMNCVNKNWNKFGKEKKIEQEEKEKKLAQEDYEEFIKKLESNIDSMLEKISNDPHFTDQSPVTIKNVLCYNHIVILIQTETENDWTLHECVYTNIGPHIQGHDLKILSKLEKRSLNFELECEKEKEIAIQRHHQIKENYLKCCYAFSHLQKMFEETVCNLSFGTGVCFLGNQMRIVNSVDQFPYVNIHISRNYELNTEIFNRIFSELKNKKIIETHSAHLNFFITVLDAPAFAIACKELKKKYLKMLNYEKKLNFIYDYNDDELLTFINNVDLTLTVDAPKSNFSQNRMMLLELIGVLAERINSLSKKRKIDENVIPKKIANKIFETMDRLLNKHHADKKLCKKIEIIKNELSINLGYEEASVIELRSGSKRVRK